MHDGCFGAKCLAFVLSGALVPSWELGTPVEAQGLAAAHPQPDSPLPLAVLFPDGQAVGEKIFKTAGAVKSYSDAEQLCREAKGQLASPRSAAENEAVAQLVRAKNNDAFLSMNDISMEGGSPTPQGSHWSIPTGPMGSPTTVMRDNQRTVWKSFLMASGMTYPAVSNSL